MQMLSPAVRSRLRPLVTERARPRRIAAAPRAWWLAVVTVCFGAFMGQLDASIVTLTFGPLERRFHTGLAGVEWVSLAYLLTLVALLAPAGRLSDAHGRKLCYLYGFVLFTLASAACGLAPSLVALLLARVAQAAGAALLQANSVALVTTSAPPDSLRPALGVQASAQALGLAIGPTVGGLLVASVGWRWVFGVNVPFGVIAFVAGYYLLPRTRHRRSVERFDWIGLLLLVIATVALLLAVSALSGLRFPGGLGGPSAEFALGLPAVVAAVGFVRWELRVAAPLVDVRALRERAFSCGLGGALCCYLVLFGPLVLVPVLLEGRQQGSGVGLVLTALPAGFALAAVVADRLLPRSWRDERRALLGAVMCVAASAGLCLVPLRPLPLAGVLLALGAGIGVVTPANNAMVMRRVPRAAAGTGGGLLNMTRGLGTAFGIALVTFAVHTDGPRAAALALLGASLLIAIAIAVVGAGE